MRIWLEVYLPFRGQLIWKGWEEVPAGTSVVHLLDRLGLGGKGGLTVLVDGRWVPPEVAIAGQEVAILRQTAGGGAP